MSKILLTVAQLAELLQINPYSVYRMVRNKRIPYLKIPGVGIRFNQSEIIDRWINDYHTEAINWDEKVRDWNR